MMTRLLAPAPHELPQLFARLISTPAATARPDLLPLTLTGPLDGSWSARGTLLPERVAVLCDGDRREETALSRTATVTSSWISLELLRAVVADVNR